MTLRKEEAALLMSENAAVGTSLTDEERMLNDLHWDEELFSFVVEAHVKDKGAKSNETITPEVTSAIIAL